MKRRGPLLVLLGMLLLLVAGLVLLFRLRLGQGDVFPPYSTLRADPLGTRALFDSLAQVPGLRLEQRLKPLATLETTPPRTVVIAGLDAEDWRHFPIDDFNALDAAVRAGSRLVIALRAHSVATGTEDDDDPREPRKKSSAKKSAKRDDKKAEGPRPKLMEADLRQLWGVNLREHRLPPKEYGALRIAESALPERVAWQSDLFFTPEQGVEWRTLYRRGREAVLLERALGRGSIVVASDSYFLSNEALQRERPTALLTWMIGPHARVLFDESHLGVVVEPGIAALARRYGLASAFFTLLLLALLFVWQRMALFVPPVDEPEEVSLAYHPAAGLEALLRRAVPAGELAMTCVAEWRRTARPGDAAQADAVLAAAPKTSSPATLHNAVLKALRRR